MDLGLRSSAYEKLQYEGHDGEPLDVELAELPKSRYISTTNSFGRPEDNDAQSLIGHSRSISGFNFQRGSQIQDDTVHSTLQTPDRRRPRRREGWRFGVTVAGYTALTVLLLNLIFTIIVGARWRDENGVATLFTGACGYVNHVTTWVHVLINIIASLLLAASNFTMQALSAPVREEIDRAHSKGDWMDIGIASVRNLSKIKWPRTVACIILASSSLPIHLLYNSALFKSIDSNQYFSIVANPKWLEGGNYTTWDSAKNSSYLDQGWGIISWNETNDLQKYFKNATALEKTGQVRNLSTSECLATYGQQFLSDFSNVIAVTNELGTSPNNTIFYANSPFESSGVQYNTAWMCDGYLPCDPQSIAKNPADWKVFGKTIDYCLAQVTPERCKLKVSLNVLIAVIVCNAAKTLVIFWTLYRQKEQTLVTIGDAIASYLERPDEYTKGRCLMSKAEIKTWKVGADNPIWNNDPSPEIIQRSKLPWLSSLSSKIDFDNWKPRHQNRRNRASGKPNTDPLPRPFRPVKKRWFAAASKTRWITTMGLIWGTLGGAMALLALGVQQLRGSGVAPFGIGFGTINSLALLSTGFYSTLVPMVLLANTPQLIASILYLMYNGLLTSMLLAKEWAQYAKIRKPLRVTSPRGQQRSTHYLQLPLRYSAPILIMSAVLHWAISQSLFVAVIDLYYAGEDQGDQVQVGYSCPPIVLAILIGAGLSIGGFVMGFMRLKSQIPVASHCSVAIAAACHRPKNDIDAALLPVLWGEVDGFGSQEIGHCAFTSRAVEPLIPGKMYAGVSSTASDGNEEAESIRQRL